MVSALTFARDEYHGRVARCRVCPSRTRYLPLEPGKSKISIRIDNAVIEYFRAHVERAGIGNYQTLMNDALLAFIQQRSVIDAVRQVVREERLAQSHTRVHAEHRGGGVDERDHAVVECRPRLADARAAASHSARRDAGHLQHGQGGDAGLVFADAGVIEDRQPRRGLQRETPPS